ncbi:MAG TPA: hypothetical protein VFY38_06760 [Pseudonocardia sp.]|nr:hypothetical protein [Pseudonocardia sp.]
MLVWLGLYLRSSTLRALVRALFADDDVHYADISEALDLPPGSIGPTRGRVLRSLRRTLEHVGLDAESA